MTTSHDHRSSRSTTLYGQEYQPGISFKILWQDPATKRRTQMARFAPGAQLPLHRHVGDELIHVIEGAVSDESGMVTAGNVGYRPDGCVHTVTSTSDLKDGENSRTRDPAIAPTAGERGNSVRPRESRSIWVRGGPTQ
jgi:quercetin dioxygenase-like cupin family protein